VQKFFAFALVLAILVAGCAPSQQEEINMSTVPQCTYLAQMFPGAQYFPQGYSFDVQNINVENLGNWRIRISDEGQVVQEVELTTTQSTILTLGKPSVQILVEFIPCGSQLWVRAQARLLEINPPASVSA